MTDQAGQGDKDKDPVSQFSDPSLIHSYAESPGGYPRQAYPGPAYDPFPGGWSPPAGASAGYSKRARWRTFAVGFILGLAAAALIFYLLR